MLPNEAVWVVPLWQEAEKYGIPLLSTEEKTFLSKIRHPVRRQEWICGRILPKRFFYEKNLTVVDSWEKFRQRISPKMYSCFTQWTVRSRNSHDQGIPPHLVGKNLPENGLFSISHAAGYLAMAYSRKNNAIGCDLCPSHVFSSTAALWFLHPEEKKLLLSFSNKVSPEILWSSKEAAYKSLTQRQTIKFQPLEWHIQFQLCQWKAVHHSGKVFSLEFRTLPSLQLVLAREGS